MIIYPQIDVDYKFISNYIKTLINTATPTLWDDALDKWVAIAIKGIPSDATMRDLEIEIQSLVGAKPKLINKVFSNTYILMFKYLEPRKIQRLHTLTEILNRRIKCSRWISPDTVCPPTAGTVSMPLSILDPYDRVFITSLHSSYESLYKPRLTPPNAVSTEPLSLAVGDNNPLRNRTREYLEQILPRLRVSSATYELHRTDGY